DHTSGPGGDRTPIATGDDDERPPQRPYDRSTLLIHATDPHHRDTGDDIMSQDADWSPDQPLGTETFEQGDDAIAEEARLDPEIMEMIELDPSLDPTLQVDERELEEVGTEFDDPEDLVVLDGGIDDPDGLGGPTNRAVARSKDDEGWDLDKPLVGGTRTDPDPDPDPID
ncbi:MAG TPA: hypothetical protein VFC03_06290, partial [Acidimicrobiales bacterium]|nr:hypothetical protein [Acidimicrobiales bacterium]